jgi:uncharacterized membrane protein YbhN (UPF0104 family)
MYFSNTTLLFVILRGLGLHASWVDVAYLGVVLNVLAQVSITPGNLGVRELVVGGLAPQLQISMATGILASSLMVSLRLALLGVVWVALETTGVIGDGNKAENCPSSTEG